MLRKFVAMLLMTLVLAGCAEDASPTEEADPTFEEFEVEVDDETGVIRGVVFDEAIVPVAGATMTLAASGEEVTSNADGAFVFADLEPGTYFLEAKALGYKPVQTSAEVVAGVANPEPVKIRLVSDPAGVPYYRDYAFKGYIMCGTDVVALCGGVRDFTGLTDDTYSAIYPTGANITHLQTEMVWESTQVLGDTFSVSHRFATQEQYDGGFYEGGITGGSGPSPLLIVTDAERYNSAGVGRDYMFMTSIFAGAAEGNPVGIGGAAVDQPYDMYIHEFHGYAPPEGWRFTDANGVPGPA